MSSGRTMTLPASQGEASQALRPKTAPTTLDLRQRLRAATLPRKTGLRKRLKRKAKRKSRRKTRNMLKMASTATARSTRKAKARTLTMPRLEDGEEPKTMHSMMKTGTRAATRQARAMMTELASQEKASTRGGEEEHF